MMQREARVRAASLRIFGAIFLLGAAQCAVADSTIYVSPGGNDTNPGLPQLPIKTLTEAVDRANGNADVTAIIFAPGVYTAELNLFLLHPTELTGPGAELEAVLIGEDTVTFHDIGIRSFGTSYSVILRHGSTIENCEFIGDPLTTEHGTIAISLISDVPCEITGNTFTDYGVGVEARRTESDPLPDYVLRNNHFIRCYAAVLATSTSIDGGTTSDPGGNIFQECFIAIANVAGLGMFFDGNQFLLRDDDTEILYGLTDYELIKALQLSGFVRLISVQNPIPAEIGGAGPQDINQDGQVNAIDIQLVINAALFGGPSADVNRDGQVNAVDVQFVINRALD
jgi:hypothetical protein